jgi:hypothetical protein
MPNLSIYVNDEIYKFLLDMGTPSHIGKQWIELEYHRRKEPGNATQ